MFNFFKAMLLMPKPWVAWVGLLMAVNMVVPVFFMARLEAKVVLATMMASAGLMMFIFAQKGFVRLLGLGHILWIPLIFWLWGRVNLEAPVTHATIAEIQVPAGRGVEDPARDEDEPVPEVFPWEDEPIDR